jgi:hypothetical protein
VETLPRPYQNITMGSGIHSNAAPLASNYQQLQQQHYHHPLTPDNSTSNSFSVCMESLLTPDFLLLHKCSTNNHVEIFLQHRPLQQ